MTVTEIKSMAEFKEATNGDTPAAIDFTATWCGPCRMISPIFEKLSEEHSDNVKFYKLDVDDVADVAAEVGIRAMPTFMIFHKGEKVEEMVGANPAGLTALIQSAKK